MMDSIAAMSMSMASESLQQNYSLALTKKVMDSQEQLALGELEMMPEMPVSVQQSAVLPSTEGIFIDTYA